MKIQFQVLCIWLILLGATWTLADADADYTWKPLYRHGKLEVFRDPSQKRLTYKAEGNIDANIFDLMAVLSDVGRRVEWVKDLVESQILEGKVDTQVVIYEQFYLPWPASNRDSVVESVIKPDLVNLEVAVVYHEVPHAAAPPRSRVVRMPEVRGSMFFRYVDDKQSFARFIISLDSGGALPTWLVNIFAKQAPVVSLEGLLKQVSKTKGNYKEFIQEHVSQAREKSKISFQYEEEK